MGLEKLVFTLLLACLCISYDHITVDCTNADAKTNAHNVNLNPGIPIAIIYHKNTSLEVRNLVDKAIRKINNGIKYGRNKWSVQTNVIDINNSFELVKTICAQMSRGVLAIFGEVNWNSIDTVKAFSDFYSIPFITWSFLNKKELLKPPSIDLFRHKIRKLRQSQMESQESEYEQSDADNQEIQTEIHDEAINNPPQTTSTRIYLRPDIMPAVIDLIKLYEWTNIYYIYNYPQAMYNLETLLDYQNKNSNSSSGKVFIRKIIDVKDCRDMLRAIEASNDNVFSATQITLIVDLDSKESYGFFLNQIKDLGMTKTRYVYLLVTFGIYELDVNDFRHGGATILGFSLVDYHNIDSFKILSEILSTDQEINRINYIPNDAALLIDGLAYFSRRINSMIGFNMSALFGMNGVSLRRAEIYINKSKGINCSYDINNINTWPLGKFIVDNLKSNQEKEPFESLTGNMNFDLNGFRTNSIIGIYKVGLNIPLSKIGFHYPERGLKITETASKKEQSGDSDVKEQRKKIVVSIKDDPFLMIRPNEPDKVYTGNDRYIGYCVDLTKKIAEIVNFTYELRLVKDGRFGGRDANGNWDGIVGELIRNEADIAIAPLTITSQRERAIEFSMPFMNMGISIMIKKPKKEKPGVFSFMAPLDSMIWFCVILAYVGVSIVLFLVSRFSPYEWHYDPEKNDHALNNDFTILNTLWFNLAAVMQQGVDIAPKSVSGRLVASVWWFFTLILISSYTANLAAFLTVERMVSPIENAEQLSRQTKIQYGAVDGGATQDFFRNSKAELHRRMWEHMQAWGPNVFVKSNSEGVSKVRDSKGNYAFLLESSLNEYLNERFPCDTMKVGNDLDSKGYGIATPFGSELRDPINLAVLQLREEGYLDELKITWWFDKGDCGTSSSGSKDSSQSPLNLINVAGIFYILIIGLMLSVLVATLELMYKAKLQSEKTKVEFKEAVKSKMRLSISGYDENIKEFQAKNSIDDKSKEISPFLK